MSFEMISFSAHADFQQTSDLIDSILPPSVILVHGEKTEMRALQEKLTVSNEYYILNVFFLSL